MACFCCCSRQHCMCPVAITILKRFSQLQNNEKERDNGSLVIALSRCFHNWSHIPAALGEQVQAAHGHAQVALAQAGVWILTDALQKTTDRECCLLFCRCLR